MVSVIIFIYVWIISSGRDVDYDDTKMKKRLSILKFGGGEIQK